MTGWVWLVIPVTKRKVGLVSDTAKKKVWLVIPATKRKVWLVATGSKKKVYLATDDTKKEFLRIMFLNIHTSSLLEAECLLKVFDTNRLYSSFLEEKGGASDSPLHTFCTW